MPLPELCPLDGKSGCKNSGCHLYHVDWRSDEENCSIGYRATQKPSQKTDQLQDTYAQNASTRLGRNIPTTIQIRHPVRNVVETTREDNVIQTPDQDKTVVEEVVKSDRDTIVTHSNHFSKKVEDALSPIDASENKNKKKGKNIDDAMKLDLPDDYEEKFWS